jgi:hypothetical protein
MIRKDFAFLRSTADNRQKFNRESKIVLNGIILISNFFQFFFLQQKFFFKKLVSLYLGLHMLSSVCIGLLSMEMKLVH